MKVQIMLGKIASLKSTIKFLNPSKGEIIIFFERMIIDKEGRLKNLGKIQLRNFFPNFFICLSLAIHLFSKTQSSQKFFSLVSWPKNKLRQK